MAELTSIVNFCDKYLNTQSIKDFERAYNGLEFENNGTVSKIGASVDFNLLIIEQAIKENVDFLIVHHGMFWGANAPVTGILHKKYQLLLNNNIAVYGAHLPLDAHKEIGNNVAVAHALELAITEHVLIDPEFAFEAPVCSTKLNIDELNSRINTTFPGTKAIMFGPKHPQRIAVCSGAIGHSIYELPKLGIDTLITGEIQQHMFGFAYEQKLNLFVCGHYATEVCGVQNLSKIIANKFQLPAVFLPESCEF